MRSLNPAPARIRLLEAFTRWSGTRRGSEPGTASPNGRSDHPRVFEIFRTSGARGKCVRFGYFPWISAAMRDIYGACVRMFRADYCIDGSATTRDGTLIELYDDCRISSRLVI